MRESNERMVSAVRDQTDKRSREARGERRAYIVLVLISIFLSVAVYIGVTVQNDQNERKFCDIVRFSLAIPAPKPADPKAHPSRERAYEGRLKVVKLSGELGC